MTQITPPISEEDVRFMGMALTQAREAAPQGEVPIGAVITCNGRVIASAHNMTEALNDVTAHAEMLAISAAAQALGGKYLVRCTLYVTVEPCPMCAGALGWSQIGRIVYGASDPKRGFLRFAPDGRGPLHPRTLLASGVLADEAADIMRDFFRRKR